jgi:hypothetical protein
MDNAKALFTLSALAKGVHPGTGELFAADSPYQTADVVRALYVGVRAIETIEKKNQRSKLPDNAGKPWTADEDRQLLERFDQGSDIPSIARYHQRTAPGIQARLERHGRLAGSSRSVRTLSQPRRLSALPETSEQT